MSNSLSGEQHECTASYIMHRSVRIIHCATGLRDLLFALVFQSLLKGEELSTALILV